MELIHHNPKEVVIEVQVQSRFKLQLFTIQTTTSQVCIIMFTPLREFLKG